ncbi:MAG: universal stress protein [Tenuifilaceae bacterium]|jgi:nucleotide-binding universal stress UspA family protein|uniref:universal stress protein n=1 Tax=Perlabentimonas gracilis TaxID=2715279 RepID=UPI00140850E8|nr:universal stress protein [Perlabentimonas gracilis]MDX9769373.1 universal stress protein [Tenuifilaceae bacterium]NHB68053.1 universal stress protein [Perlabentimonas gracilis]
MEIKSQKLIVPWDFTNVSENALLYALKIGSFTDSFTIDLIHVVEAGGMFAKGKLTEKEASEKIKSDAVRIKEQYGVDVKTVIQEGSIFHTISEYAFDIEADTVIMGTHGIKGVQKLTGSKALKVIAGSNVPFLVIQDAPKEGRIFENIVFPLDYRLNEKERLRWAIRTAHQFNSRIHIILPHATDAGIQKKVNYNLAFAKKHLEANEINLDVHNAAKGANYSDEIVKLAVDIEADLILIMTTPNLDFTDYIFGAQEQYVIANNAKIPVLCVNPAMV